MGSCQRLVKEALRAEKNQSQMIILEILREGCLTELKKLSKIIGRQLVKKKNRFV